MNNPNNPPDDREQQLRDDLSDLYHLPVPAMRFEPNAARVNVVERTMRHGWRPALVGGAAAAGLALFVAASSVFNGGADAVRAEDLFEKAKEVTSATNLPLEGEPYHLVARSDATVKSATSTISEMWFKDAEHQRTETRDAATGEVLWGSVQDGDDLWMYSEVEGEMTAVHSRIGADMGFGFAVGGFGVPGAASLSDILDVYTNECSDATNVGEDVVAARPVYVIEVTSKGDDSCKLGRAIQIEPVAEGAHGTVTIEDPAEGEIPESGTSADIEPRAETKPGEPPVGMATSRSVDANGEVDTEVMIVASGPMRMWIDQETFMTLKSESDFGDAGSHVYEVTSLELGEAAVADDAIFAPPAGAKIVEATSPEDANIVLKGMFQTAPIAVGGGSNEAVEPAEAR